MSDIASKQNISSNNDNITYDYIITWLWEIPSGTRISAALYSQHNTTAIRQFQVNDVNSTGFTAVSAISIIILSNGYFVIAWERFSMYIMYTILHIDKHSL